VFVYLLTADKGWSSRLVAGLGASNPHRRETTCYEMLYRALKVRPVAVRCENGNEPSGPIKDEEFLD